MLSEYLSHMTIDRGGTALRDGVDSDLLRRRDNAVPIFLALRKAVKFSGEEGVIYQHLHNEPVRLKECHVSRAPNEVETIWNSLTYKHRVRFCTIILIASTSWNLAYSPFSSHLSSLMCKHANLQPF